MKIINVNNANEARKIIDKMFKEGTKVIVMAKDDEFNRTILENKRVDFLIDVESGNKHDRLKQRDSGLNQVLCKLARDNEVSIGINLRHLNKGSDFEKAKYLSRLLQNVKLCKKYQVKMVLFNVDKRKKDLNGLLLTLGMSTDMAKFAFENSFSFN